MGLGHVVGQERTRNTAGVRVELSGLEELHMVLSGVSKEVRLVVLSAAVTEAAKPLVAAAKRYAPRRTGALQKSIKAKTLRNKTNGFAVALVGPSTEYFHGAEAVKKGGSRKGADRPCNYAHLVEFGHNSPNGFISAKPFMRPAVVIAGQDVSRAMTLGMQKGLTRAVMKYKKGNLL